MMLTTIMSLYSWRRSSFFLDNSTKGIKPFFPSIFQQNWRDENILNTLTRRHDVFVSRTTVLMYVRHICTYHGCFPFYALLPLGKVRIRGIKRKKNKSADWFSRRKTIFTIFHIRKKLLEGQGNSVHPPRVELWWTTETCTDQ